MSHVGNFVGQNEWEGRSTAARGTLSVTISHFLHGFQSDDSTKETLAAENK